MVVLSSTRSTTTKRAIVIIGVGLVGSSIVKSLLLFENFHVQKLKSDWRRLDNFITDLAAIADEFKLEKINQVDWVWSAGKAGFAAVEEEVQREFAFFEAFLKQIATFKSRYGGQVKSRTHLVSSAGGLFEGQRVMSRHASPLPKRPYGHLKLRQERLLIEMFPGESLVYRPSSIFGFYAKGQRVGLITNLIVNTLRAGTTSIFGKIDTLRDYVWCGDVANFIALKIWFDFGNETEEIHFLVSGKPTSIFEIQYTIQTITNLKVLQKFDKNFSNADQIVFSQNIVSDGWRSSPLDTCIRQIFQRGFN